MTDQPSAEYEDKKDATSSNVQTVRFWLDAIDAASGDEEDWREEAQEVIEIYRGDCDEGQDEFNIVYSNCETLLPAIYNSTPSPDVRRRFNDRDPISKTVADILERSISHSVDSYDFDDVMRGVLFDGTIAGRGVARARYLPGIPDEATGKSYQAVSCEYVPWQNFRRGPGRTWDDVPWIAFEHFLNRDELKKLNEKLADKVQMDCRTGGGDNDADDSDKPSSDIFKRARVWEIWDRDRKEVVFIATGYSFAPLRTAPDPLKLQGFYPIPRPVQPIATAGDLTPVTTYRAYRKLAEELNEITIRIKKLIKQLRVRGGYAAGGQDLSAITSADDGELVPMQGLEALLDGGIDKAITWWPIEPTVKALVSLYQQREQVKQTIYEVTGISDIVRGASQASETATAQQIKQQWGSLRIQRMQGEVQRFARDLFRLKAEIIATFFEPENLTAITGIKLVPQAMIQQAQMALQPPPQQPGQPPMPQHPPPPGAEEIAKAAPLEPVMQILRDDIMRSYRIDVESDSTIRADLTRNQKNMSDFLQGTAQFIAAVGPAVQAGQLPGEVATEIYTSFARNFKLGKQAEDALDKMGEDARNAAKQPKQDKPDPEMAKVQGQQQLEQQRLAMEGQLKAKDAELKQAEQEHKQAIAAADLQLQREKAQAEIELKRQIEEIKLQMDQQRQQHEIQMKMHMAEQDHALKAQGMERDHALRQEKQSSDIRMGRDKQVLDYRAKGVKQMSSSADENEASVDPQAEIESFEEKVDGIEQGVQSLAAGMAQMMQMLAEMQQAHDAPKSVIRDAQGNIVGVQHGDKVKRITRDGAGRVAGLN